jgi:hypothetical protein
VRYKERNTVERCFSKLKQFRAVATRYDKRDFMYQATVDVASIRIWLRDPVPRSTQRVLAPGVNRRDAPGSGRAVRHAGAEAHGAAAASAARRAAAPG